MRGEGWRLTDIPKPIYSLSEPRFLHLQNGGDKIPYAVILSTNHCADGGDTHPKSNVYVDHVTGERVHFASPP